jgi:hypothetical protein
VLSIKRNNKLENNSTIYSKYFYVYDNAKIKEELERHAEIASDVEFDKVGSQALAYIGLGDALAGLLSGGSSDVQIDELFPLRFLQYWKALTAIVGDPSGDRDHQSRPTKLGLGRQFFRQVVRPLTEIRDNFDVAHISRPGRQRFVTSQNVEDCRHAAVLAIRAHFGLKEV